MAVWGFRPFYTRNASCLFLGSWRSFHYVPTLALTSTQQPIMLPHSNHCLLLTRRGSPPRILWFPINNTNSDPRFGKRSPCIIIIPKMNQPVGSLLDVSCPWFYPAGQQFIFSAEYMKVSLNCTFWTIFFLLARGCLVSKYPGSP